VYVQTSVCGIINIIICTRFTTNQGDDKMPRIDERNIMFSRIARTEGTKEYDDYYTRNPQNKEFDDSLRAMPPMNGDSTKFFHPLNSPMVDAAFAFLSDIRSLVEGPPSAEVKVEASPEEFTKKLKGLSELYGAKLTGVAPLDGSYYYTQPIPLHIAADILCHMLCTKIFNL